MKAARWALAVVVIGFCFSKATAQGFLIDHWTENIDLRSDAVFHVEERISVTFTEEKHGIFRTIPVSYPTGHGTTRNLILKDIKVLDETGAAVNFNEDDSGGKVQLRIGDADRLLPAGTHKAYIIRYLVSNGINWFDDPKWIPSAQLYWNVTGTDWPVNIRACDTTITFPKVSDPKALRIKVFTGPLGARLAQLVIGPAQ